MYLGRVPVEELKRGRWRAGSRTRSTPRLAYREPAGPDAERPPPSVIESGRYQALRESWLRAWLRRWLRRR